MTVRVLVRGFKGRTRVFQDPERHLTAKQIEALLPELGEKHAGMMAAGMIDMIEIEFPDDPPEERYFRIGTNPAGMVMPVRVL